MQYEQILLWLGMYTVASLLGLPIAAAVFARVPGRGAGFAPTVGLGIITLITYWIGHIRFGLIAIVVGVVVLSTGAGFGYRRAVINWWEFGDAMAIFVGGYLCIVAISAVDPGLIPFTEDFLNYGLMRAILRTGTLPPEDFWFAGQRVRYHYGGHLLAALQTMLTGTSTVPTVDS